MISEAYRELQTQKHAMGSYGTSGHMYAAPINELAKQLNTTDILDYGCGKRTLETALGYFIRNYDPAIPEVAEPPSYPADIVTCTDCLEHIEPEFLEAVLDDLQRLTRKIGFFVIATGPANKTLADGRNAHLIQEGPEWWLPKIMARFDLRQFTSQKHCFIVLVKARATC
jgi:hypothetical protein